MQLRSLTLKVFDIFAKLDAFKTSIEKCLNNAWSNFERKDKSSDENNLKGLLNFIETETICKIDANSKICIVK